MEQNVGRSGAEAPSGHSASPEPVVSALRASVPNAVGGRNGAYAGDPQFASAYYARWPYEKITLASAGSANV
jgi:hypothetical protein